MCPLSVTTSPMSRYLAVTPSLAEPSSDRRSDVLLLLRAGHTRREISHLTGASVSTIGRLARTARSANEDGVSKPFGRPGRPRKAEPFRSFVSEQVRDNPGVLSKDILRRARGHGYTGGKTALYRLIAELREGVRGASTVVEQTPGAVCEHEVGAGCVRFTSGGHAQVLFVASRLSYSRWLEVSLVNGCDIEGLIRALVRHFARMGGLPLSSNLFVPKRVPLLIHRAGIREWHPALAQAALDLGIGLVLRSPGDRTRAEEPLAPWIKERFFKSRPFRDMVDVRTQLVAWLSEVNNKLPSRVTQASPVTRLEYRERSCLRQLPTDPQKFAVRVPAVVGPTGKVRYDHAVYKLPLTTAGMLATLCLEESRVSIVVGQHRVDYERRRSSAAE
jgi:Trp repressor protein